MKKLSLKLLVLLIIALIPVNVYALSGSISASCSPATVSPGDTFTCTIAGTSDEAVTSISAEFGVSGSITVVGFQAGSGWEGNDINNNHIDVYTSSDISGNFTIGTMTIKVNDDASAGGAALSLSNIVYNDSDDKETTIAGAETGVEIVINEAPVVIEKGLSSLSCSSGGILSPQLKDDNYGYSIILDSPQTNSFSISATPKSSDATISYIDVETGETLNANNITFKTTDDKPGMLINIIVGSGESKVTYIITVNKPVIEKGYLGSLTVGGKTIELDNNKFDYQVTLDSVDSYQIVAAARDSSKFVVYSPNVSRELSGENSYEIVVKPIDGNSGFESTTYVISVSKTGTVPQPTERPATQAPAQTNPQTGEGGIVTMAVILVISLMITVYLYKRNMAGYTN